MAHLNKLLVDVLDSYNEVNAVMNLVSSVQADSTGKGLGPGFPVLSHYEPLNGALGRRDSQQTPPGLRGESVPWKELSPGALGC